MSIPKGVPLGARVEYIGNNPEIKGEEGTIIKFWSDCVLVEFDNPIPFPYGHDGRSVGEWCGKDGHCRWFSLENEGLVVKSMPHDETMGELMKKFKKGDRVVVTSLFLGDIKEGVCGTVLFPNADEALVGYCCGFPPNFCGVVFDKPYDFGGDFHGACEPGCGFWIPLGQLELVATIDDTALNALLLD